MNRCHCGRFAPRWWRRSNTAWTYEAPWLVAGAFTGTSESEFPRVIAACRAHVLDALKRTGARL